MTIVLVRRYELPTVLNVHLVICMTSNQDILRDFFFLILNTKTNWRTENYSRIPNFAFILKNKKKKPLGGGSQKCWHFFERMYYYLQLITKVRDDIIWSNYFLWFHLWSRKLESLWVTFIWYNCSLVGMVPIFLELPAYTWQLLAAVIRMKTMMYLLARDWMDECQVKDYKDMTDKGNQEWKENPMLKKCFNYVSSTIKQGGGHFFMSYARLMQLSSSGFWKFLQWHINS